VGMLLFTKYALPFEITSVILLVAAIGAVVLTHNEEMVGIRRRLLGERKKE
jgi:NADH-quinone oxidoreductase subunit J